MISANRAKVMTAAARRLQTLDEAITKACERGEYEVVPNFKLDSVEKELLTKAGYKIVVRNIKISSNFGAFDADGDAPDTRPETYITWNS